MADAPVRDAFDGLLPLHAKVEGLAIATVADPGFALIMARDQEALGRRVEDTLTATLPGPSRALTSGAVTLVAVSRGAWLAVGSGGAAFAATMARALAGVAHVADQSGAYGLLELSGPRACEVLAKGLPIDLHPSALGADGAAVSRIGGVGVTLWRLPNGDGFAIATPRSSAGSFAHWLRASAAGSGLALF